MAYSDFAELCNDGLVYISDGADGVVLAVGRSRIKAESMS